MCVVFAFRPPLIRDVDFAFAMYVIVYIYDCISKIVELVYLRSDDA